MFLVDSSVSVDHLRGTPTPQADKQFNEVRRMQLNLTVVPLGSQDVATAAARHNRRLRAVGPPVRKTADAVIATRCIVDKRDLLNSDRTFEPFEQHLGLRSVPRQASRLN